MKINWKQLWGEFDEWYDKSRYTADQYIEFPEWKAQQDKIEELVNSRVEKIISISQMNNEQA